MNRLEILFQATRARTLPVMLAPVLIGSVLAWQQGAPFQWGLFVLALLGALAAHLGANVVNDVFDFSEGTDQTAQKMVPEGTTLATGSQALMRGQLSLQASRGLALALFALALPCGIGIAFFPPSALALGLAGFIQASLRLASPLPPAELGRRLG